MSEIIEEVELWNTPLINAFLLWRFTIGYSNFHPSKDAPVAILHFIANAILSNKRLSKPITGKRDSLQSYVNSFEEKKSIDLLLNIQERVKEKRKKTLEAIDVAVGNGLLFWEFETGKLFPKENLKKPQKGNNLKDLYKKEGKKAEILGKWFSQHDINSIALYLKIIL